MTTRARIRRSRRPLALGVILLTAALSLSGCGEDDEPTENGAASSESPGGSDGTDDGESGDGDSDDGDSDDGESDDGESQAPPGVAFDRPAFSMELPKGWKDNTDEAMIEPTDNEIDAFKPVADVVDDPPAVRVSFSEDVHYRNIKEARQLALRSLTDNNPKQKFLGMTTYAGEEAIHFAGPGIYDGSYVETYEFLHDNDWYQVQVETYTGKRAASALHSQVDSTWEWK